ncbi:MAG: hypothetical protein HRU41_40985, partial [Saprospiraceae bacterium]|nr:hypothetical protein [Saprospiraceae bacterium]
MGNTQQQTSGVRLGLAVSPPPVVGLLTHNQPCLLGLLLLMGYTQQQTSGVRLGLAVSPCPLLVFDPQPTMSPGASAVDGVHPTADLGGTPG